MARADEGLLDVQGAVRKRRLCLGGGGPERAFEFVLRADQAHAAPPSARGRLEQHGEADVGGKGLHLLQARGSIRSGDERKTGGRNRRLCRDLVPHRLDRLWAWADEHEVVVLTSGGEACVLREEAPARVHGVAVGRGARGDERTDIEVAVGGRRRPDVHGVVG